MTLTLNVIPAEPGHVALLAGRLRSGDAAELEAAGLGSRNALWRSYRGSVIAKTALIDGEPAAMWGCGGSPLSGVGQPWLLTGPAVERVPVSFVRIGRDEVAGMLLVYRRLWGYVAATYPRACRLLEVLGFELSEPFPFGPIGALFRRYEMER